MHLRHLELYRFRNLKEQTITFPQRLTLILGDNGQGKTSIIEAIYLLAHAKSFRSNRSRELVSWLADAESSSREVDCSVDGRLESESGTKTLRCAISKGKRSIFLNGNRLETASSFYGQLNCVVFTPDDLILVKGSPSNRRSFLDRILAMSDRGYVDSLVAYQRALRSRNKIISEQKDRSSLLQVVRPWDQLLVEHGRIVAEKRKHLIDSLQPHAQKFYQSLVPKQNEEIAFSYQSHFLDTHNTLISAETMRSVFADSLAKDSKSRGTSVGTHRDEVEISLDTGSGFHSARIGASQGQSRSIALSLKLAAVQTLFERTGELPIVLLDDVESELDSSRRSAFYKLLGNFETQIILTATELSPELKIACPQLAQVLISDGEVRSIESPAT